MSNSDLPHDQVVARAAEALAHSYADLCHYAAPSREGMRNFGSDVAHEAWKIMEIWSQQDVDYDSYKERERDMHGLVIDETSDGNETHQRSQVTGVSARKPGTLSFKFPNLSANGTGLRIAPAAGSRRLRREDIGCWVPRQAPLSPPLGCGPIGAREN